MAEALSLLEKTESNGRFTNIESNHNTGLNPANIDHTNVTDTGNQRNRRNRVRRPRKRRQHRNILQQDQPRVYRKNER